jgi:hypothetical protein
MFLFEDLNSVYHQYSTATINLTAVLLNVQNTGGNPSQHYVISDFRCEVAENCALQGHYAVSSGNFLPKFRDNLLVPSRFFQVYSNKQRNGLVPWNRNLIVCAIAEEPTVFLKSPTFVAVFISFHNCTVFSATSVQSTPSYP